MHLFGKAAGVIAVAGALSLTAVAAGAATLTVQDPRFDALGFTDYEMFDLDDYDIDLVSVDIDHGTRDLKVSSRFTELIDDSWTFLSAQLDTNGDGTAEYIVLADKQEALLRDASDRTVCVLPRVKETLGFGGRLDVTVPRSCIGNPRQVSVHVDAAWIGLNDYEEDLYFVDSAPGEFLDDVTTFSRPVLSSNTGTATSPAAPKTAPKPPPAKATSVKVSLNKKVARVGKSPVKITVRPKAAGNPAGRVEIVRNGKLMKKISVRAGKKAAYTFPKRLKAGKHKITVTFRPTDTKGYKVSTARTTFTVKKK